MAVKWCIPLPLRCRGCCAPCATASARSQAGARLRPPARAPPRSALPRSGPYAAEESTQRAEITSPCGENCWHQSEAYTPRLRTAHGTLAAAVHLTGALCLSAGARAKPALCRHAVLPPPPGETGTYRCCPSPARACARMLFVAAPLSPGRSSGPLITAEPDDQHYNIRSELRHADKFFLAEGLCPCSGKSDSRCLAPRCPRAC